MSGKNAEAAAFGADMQRVRVLYAAGVNSDATVALFGYFGLGFLAGAERWRASIATLARATQLTPRQVKDGLARLRARGLIEGASESIRDVPVRGLTQVGRDLVLMWLSQRHTEITVDAELNPPTRAHVDALARAAGSRHEFGNTPVGESAKLLTVEDRNTLLSWRAHGRPEHYRSILGAMCREAGVDGPGEQALDGWLTLQSCEAPVSSPTRIPPQPEAPLPVTSPAPTAARTHAYVERTAARVMSADEEGSGWRVQCRPGPGVPGVTGDDLMEIAGAIARLASRPEGGDLTAVSSDELDAWVAEVAWTALCGSMRSSGPILRRVRACARLKRAGRWSRPRSMPQGWDRSVVATVGIARAGT